MLLIHLFVGPFVHLSCCPLIHLSIHPSTYMQILATQILPHKNQTHAKFQPLQPEPGLEKFQTYASRSISEPLLAPNPSLYDLDIGLLVLDSNLIRRGLKSLYVQMFHEAPSPLRNRCPF